MPHSARGTEARMTLGWMAAVMACFPRLAWRSAAVQFAPGFDASFHVMIPRTARISSTLALPAPDRAERPLDVPREPPPQVPRRQAADLGVARITCAISGATGRGTPRPVRRERHTNTGRSTATCGTHHLDIGRQFGQVIRARRLTRSHARARRRRDDRPAYGGSGRCISRNQRPKTVKKPRSWPASEAYGGYGR